MYYYIMSTIYFCIVIALYIYFGYCITESERSATLEPLPEGRADWRPAVLPDSDVVKALETVEGKREYLLFVGLTTAQTLIKVFLC